ncbi:MAG: DNA mismatch repair protein MutS [Gemmatimonadetes bacterium]|nr:DNA mismatch repair protein MutS [Gemmatimonadota bacterium]NIR76907.1 DNA mismatch repair protein MutS [Gemmatimonadota bacterium]NIT85436.1 DNA mismatch repair protein MutS [Gemmatimonadota bacterium]NIU29253.1 DNA mismatch repair protein MutS [Gemmatimonadota bacterium]NIU34335.1 DNA mismatch repair protein MutS [Gemmatimonadota bacterium]
MTGHPGPSQAAETYRERRERFLEAAEAEGRAALRISRIRVAFFVAAVAALSAADLSGGPLAGSLLAAGLLSLAALFVYVGRHRRVREREDRLRRIASLNRRALARLRREWDALPGVPAEPGDEPSHPYAADLEVTGERSLLRLCSDVMTRPGWDTLSRWLLEPGAAAEVARRQEAVSELAPMLDFRQELAAVGEGGPGPDTASVDRLAAWAEEGGPALPAWLLWTSWVLPPLSLGLLVAHLGGLTAAPWWGLSLLAAWAAVRSRKNALDETMERIGAGAARVGRYGDLLEHLATLEAEAPLLRRIREAVREGELEAAEELRRLRRRADWAEVRRNGLLHAPLQLFLLWDVHVVRSLEGWRSRVGGHARDWLESLGLTEALCALATLKADHPDWCFPEIRPESERLVAEGLGHPLLSRERCVRNDVVVGPPGTFLFVTGSNMAGKSTLLRALGLNAVLARAGGPACARSLRMPPLRVRTSMRVKESLTEGISYFMAELRRVRRVVEAARDPGGDPGEPVLYLLDEPLQGTNEAERRVAVQTILRHLLRTSALGALATHDLRLHAAELLDEAARPVHLEGAVEEGEEGPVLSFDYRLRVGLATSSNALSLLEAVGLGEEKEEGEP